MKVSYQSLDSSLTVSQSIEGQIITEDKIVPFLDKSERFVTGQLENSTYRGIWQDPDQKPNLSQILNFFYNKITRYHPSKKEILFLISDIKFYLDALDKEKPNSGAERRIKRKLDQHYFRAIEIIKDLHNAEIQQLALESRTTDFYKSESERTEIKKTISEKDIILKCFEVAYTIFFCEYHTNECKMYKNKHDDDNLNDCRKNLFDKINKLSDNYDELRNDLKDTEAYRLHLANQYDVFCKEINSLKKQFESDFESFVNHSTKITDIRDQFFDLGYTTIKHIIKPEEKKYDK